VQRLSRKPTRTRKAPRKPKKVVVVAVAAKKGWGLRPPFSYHENL